MNERELCTLAGHVLDRRHSLLSLWQEIADNFYPERGWFTVKRTLGEEFADHLMSSYPVMVRRDLGNSFNAMLRPKAKNWFHIRPKDEEREDDVAAMRWLEMAENTQRRAMYDTHSQFVRACKEGDHDFATFGQCVLSVNLNRYRNGLMYRCYHMRDVGWMENADGNIDTVARRWTPTAKELRTIFGEAKLASKVNNLFTAGDPKKQYTEIECVHLVLPAEMFEDNPRKQYVSIYLDKENEHIIEKVFTDHFEYVIPRWQTVSGYQYAFSPATIVALPDARLIQAMMLTLLEAGEKASNPPLIATSEAVMSGIELYAGGVTWVDAEYDERLGDVLRPISQDYRGLPNGLEIHDRVAAQIVEAFYINKLALPPANRKDMTAYEVSQRVEEYVRAALPLFEPMEQEYNGQICEKTFNLMFAHGGFGSPFDIPPSLRGAEVEFRFESPLHENIERIKGQRFLETEQLLEQAMQLDPDVIAFVDIHTAFKDALQGIQVPSEWRRDDKEAEVIIQQHEKIRAAQAQLQMEGGAANVQQATAEAQKSMTDAQRNEQQPRTATASATQ